jgi:hypothetical protein
LKENLKFKANSNKIKMAEKRVYDKYETAFDSLRLPFDALFDGRFMPKAKTESAFVMVGRGEAGGRNGRRSDVLTLCPNHVRR